MFVSVQGGHSGGVTGSATWGNIQKSFLDAAGSAYILTFTIPMNGDMQCGISEKKVSIPALPLQG